MKEKPNSTLHDPFEEGECLSCHNPHASEHEGVLNARQDVLCFDCHEDVGDELAEATSKHEPAVNGECTSCHSPHQAALDPLLLAKSPDLCLACHTDIGEKLDEQRAHKPAAKDCMNCHKPHSSIHPKLNTLPLLELCGECHDYEEEPFKEAHLDIKAVDMNCNSCHAPHASKDKKFFKQKVHSPFAKRTCEDCHVVEQR